MSSLLSLSIHSMGSNIIFSWFLLMSTCSKMTSFSSKMILFSSKITSFSSKRTSFSSKMMPFRARWHHFRASRPHLRANDCSGLASHAECIGMISWWYIPSTLSPSIHPMGTNIILSRFYQCHFRARYCHFRASKRHFRARWRHFRASRRNFRARWHCQ